MVKLATYPNVPPPQLSAKILGCAILDGTLPSHPGVYFVWNNTRCVYVGKSSCLTRRVTRSHPKIRDDDFISFLTFSEGEVPFAECFYIGICKPERNFGGSQFDRNTYAKPEAVRRVVAALENKVSQTLLRTNQQLSSYDQELLTKNLNALLSDCSPKTIRILRLKFAEGLSVVSICRQCKISAGTLNRLTRRFNCFNYAACYWVIELLKRLRTAKEDLSLLFLATQRLVG